MLPVNPDFGGTEEENAAYTLVAAARTQRVTGDSSLEDIVVVTARSAAYGVTFSWFVDPINWKADGAPALVGLKTSQVNQVCAHDHVIGFRSVQDLDPSRLLVNFAIITVGTDDGVIQEENSAQFKPVRMDQLGTPLPFAVADAMWATLHAVGA